MIEVTGDTHGERGRMARLLNEGGWQKGDTLIVGGDFGYVFTNSEMEKEFLDAIAQMPVTVCFCDGNHENFPAIYAYPKETYCGGYVHRIRHNVLHLMRGQVYEIEGKKIFTMGGAYSIDKHLRMEGLSWWREELPSNEEYHEAITNLREHNNTVDYIITHTAPREIIRRMGHYPDMHDGELTGFLEWVMYEVSFRKWYFGHWHTDREIGEKFCALYHDVRILE